jgi:hypothetical protein
MIERMRIDRFRMQRSREKRTPIDAYRLIVEGLTGPLTDRQRADAEAALAVAPNDPQGKLL